MSKKLPTTRQNPYLQRLDNGEITRDILLKERDVMLDLYKHHLKLLLEANVFVYAVTGALASFVITHPSVPHVRWVLLLPSVVCAGFAGLFAYVTFEIGNTKEELNYISEALKTNTFPAIDALPIGLWVSAGALTAILLLLIAGMIWFPTPPPTVPGAAHGYLRYLWRQSGSQQRC